MEMKKTNPQLILVVEDDKAILTSVRTILTYKGYQVETAENGQAALDKLDEMDERPCLIFLDLMMPIMDGWQFLHKIRNELHYSPESLPVVITSAAKIDEKTDKGTSELAQAYLKKPINMQTLLDTVLKFCD